MTSRSSVAPGTMLIRPSNSASLPTLVSRHTATTSYPRANACWTMYFPSFPDAPTTQILMTDTPRLSVNFVRLSPRTPSSRNPRSESTQVKLGGPGETASAQWHHCHRRLDDVLRAFRPLKRHDRRSDREELDHVRAPAVR